MNWKKIRYPESRNVYSCSYCEDSYGAYYLLYKRNHSFIFNIIKFIPLYFLCDVHNKVYENIYMKYPNWMVKQIREGGRISFFCAFIFSSSFYEFVNY